SIVNPLVPPTHPEAPAPASKYRDGCYLRVQVQAPAGSVERASGDDLRGGGTRPDMILMVESWRPQLHNLLVDDHTDDALASYAVAASGFLPPFAKATKRNFQLI
ncbi:unnamed protein product, partial [Urochloa humidicola]